ncbi:hypothetical protein J3R82DRAFT_2859 [Butyriboletus roseoflavus]|nr:hypothetical protein J3R82DRAFT_2859 [Butyriboletus roseoflavus]
MVQYLMQNHSVVNFISMLQAFLAGAHLPYGHQYFQPNNNDHFDCFSTIVQLNPFA